MKKILLLIISMTTTKVQASQTELPTSELPYQAIGKYGAFLAATQIVNNGPLRHSSIQKKFITNAILMGAAQVVFDKTCCHKEILIGSIAGILATPLIEMVAYYK